MVDHAVVEMNGVDLVTKKLGFGVLPPFFANQKKAGMTSFTSLRVGAGLATSFVLDQSYYFTLYLDTF